MSRRRKGVPEWEEYPHTPAVFVRVANKGVAGYGTWKSVRKMEDRRIVTEFLVNLNRDHPPLFSELRILKDFKCRVFGTAHSKGVTGAFCGSAHSKGVRADIIGHVS
jgi:hypothetical protein